MNNRHTHTELYRAYLARRIVRATNPTTRKRLEKQADSDVRKMVLRLEMGDTSGMCTAAIDETLITYVRNSK